MLDCLSEAYNNLNRFLDKHISFQSSTMRRLPSFCLSLAGALLFLLLAGPTLLATPVVFLKSSQDSYSLDEHLEIMEDPTGKWTFSEIQTAPLAERFVPLTETGNNFGYTDSAFWVRLRIKNTDKTSVDWWLEYVNAAVEQIQYFDGSDTNTAQHSGSLTALNRREIPYRHPSFALALRPGEERTLYLRIESRTDINVVMFLQTTSEFQRTSNLEQTWSGVFYGTVMGMVLYNFFLFVAVRHRIYLFYSLYQLGTLVHWSFIDGTIHQLFPEGIGNPVGWRTVWAAILAIAVIPFAQNLLATSERNPHAHRILNFMLVLFLPFLFAPFFASDWISSLSQAVYMLTAFLYLPLLSVLITGALQGFRPAHLSLLCWGVFAVGAALSYLAQIGWIPSTTITRNSMPFGVMLEALLFSLALADRIREFREAKDAAQHEAIRSLTLADELKDRLLASTSHELRTPLHGIIGLSESIRDSSGSQLTQGDFSRLELVISNSRRLSYLVGDMLDLSALRDHRLNLHLEPTPLYTLTESVLRLTEPLIRGKNLRCLNAVSLDLPSVFADPNRLQQVLLNLVNNAIKYTDSGTVTISARLEKETVLVEVADTGAGIEANELKRIFESFERGEHTENIAGLGLGLSISRELLTAHGSRLEVRSTPKEGSTFSFKLSAAAKSEAQPLFQIPKSSLFPAQHPVTEYRPAASETESTAALECILVVDDDPTNLEVAAGHLSGLGNALILCLNGQEALDELESNPNIRLVLLDVMMPGVDGLEVCELIREQHSPEELPVLLLTALNQEEDIALGLQAGASDYLTKPLHKAELRARVSAHLDLARLRRQHHSTPSTLANEARQMLVETQLLALEIWESETGKTVLDFAQESEIWGYSLDRKSGSWRTRSLNHYLSVVTLPSKPRWRKVLQSAQFVLRHCTSGSAAHSRLQNQLDDLNRQLREQSL